MPPDRETSERVEGVLENVAVTPSQLVIAPELTSDNNQLRADANITLSLQTCEAGNQRILDLSGKKLDSLPPLLSYQLSVLIISENQFEILPLELCQLTSLSSLIVCNNKLRELPEDIGDLKYLTIFKASKNHLQSLPCSFSKLNLLKELDLSRNNFHKVPDSLQVGCKSLQHINLDFNHLESWHHPPASVNALCSVSLSNNEITVIPLWLFDGRAFYLQTVNINFNPIYCSDHRNLSSSAVGRTLTHLKRLNMSNCMLSDADFKFIGLFETLTHLELSSSTDRNFKNCSNLIRAIDVSALKCSKSLIELSLRNVGLPDLPENIEELASLEILDCRDNIIMMLPENFSKLRRLRVCLLSGNSICLIPDNFGDLTELTELSLKTNSVSSLPESFRNLKNLRWLDLYENKLNDLPEQLDCLVENLKGLDLERNFFDVPSALGDGVNWLSEQKYEEMLYEIRNYYCSTDTEEDTAIYQLGDRHRGIRPSEKCCSETSSLDSIEKYYDDDSDERSSFGKPDSNCKEEEEEEKWDAKSSDSDNFSPVEDSVRPPPILASNFKIPGAGPQLERIEVPSSILKPHSFCPSDIHVPSTRRKQKVEITFPPEEGQFDDA